MSTLRTICLVCAGYYLLQSLGFMFDSATAGAVRGMMPESADAHPIVQLQGDIASVMTAFAPYLLIGVAVCLLMAWRLKPWWRAVPVLSVLLFAGGLFWLLAFVRHMRPFSQQIGRSIGEGPDAFSSYMEVVAGIGNWSSALPVLLPGVLIFIFWWRARSAARRAALS